MDDCCSAVHQRRCISATNTTSLVESPRRSSASSLHEFQFWSSSAPAGDGDHPAELLTADELFVNGVLLPLRLLSLHRSESTAEVTTPTESELGLPQALDVGAGDLPPPCSSSPSACAGSSFSASISCAPTTASRRWKDIFKVGEKKKTPATAEVEKKRNKSAGGGTAPEEQHLSMISIWPFGRSRSAGSNDSGGRRKPATISGRRASSAPCSRSNSRGESSKSPSASTTAGSRRWAVAASPGRGVGGVHVGRMSPVWQIRRPERKGKVSGVGGRKGSSDGVGVRVLNLNLNTCIGYRSQGSCRCEDRGARAGVARTAAAVGGGSGGGGGLLTPLRTLFSKKVVY